MAGQVGCHQLRTKRDDLIGGGNVVLMQDMDARLPHERYAMLFCRDQTSTTRITHTTNDHSLVIGARKCFNSSSSFSRVREAEDEECKDRADTMSDVEVSEGPDDSLDESDPGMELSMDGVDDSMVMRGCPCSPPQAASHCREARTRVRRTEVRQLRLTQFRRHGGHQDGHRSRHQRARPVGEVQAAAREGAGQWSRRARGRAKRTPG